MKKQDLRVSANNLGSVFENPNISLPEQSFSAASRPTVLSQALTEVTEVVGFSGKSMISSRRPRRSLAVLLLALGSRWPFRFLLFFPSRFSWTQRLPYVHGFN
jgi:hypothetical protein